MPPVTIEQTFGLAAQHHQAGRLREAEGMYRQVLAQQPEHPDALHLLGVLALQEGRNDLAVQLIRQAAALHPASATVFYNLGNALKARGELGGAIVAYCRATQIRPDYAAAHNNLGIALNSNGQVEESIAAFRRAVSLRPDRAGAYYNLGDALRSGGQLTEAIAAYRQAIALQPDYADAHNNLANALKDEGQLDEAIAGYRAAIGFRPDCAEFHSNLGNVLKDQGKTAAAVAAYRQAIDLDPKYADAHYNLGNVLKDGGQLDDAIDAYRRAISLRPDYCEAYSNLGNALADSGQIGAAIAAYRQVVSLRPDLPEAHSNLVYSMQFDPAYDAQAIAEEHRRWNLRHAEPLRQAHGSAGSPQAGSTREYRNHPSPQRRLRIGYVSPNFWEHCQSLFLVPLFSAHDRQQVEIFCYSQVMRPDLRTSQLQTFADGWRNILGRSDEEVASLIRQDQIDILVDLTMHLANNRLLVFARKPAPVQVTWLAYPGTTGLGAIDYRLSDPHLDPPGMDESIYSEKTIRLPDSFWCYDPLDGREIPVRALPALESGHITFGCLNNFCKVNDGILAIWAQVLNRVKHSRLLLLAKEGRHRERTKEQMADSGVDPSRIEFVPFLPRQAYLELYHRIDVSLDTFPYNGHTTSLDSLWMGVPVVSLVGKTAVSRAGWSQLSNLGLRELAAETSEQFVRLAVQLSSDLPRLTALRSTLRQRMEQSPLMDAPKFARNIESAYRRMWLAWCESYSGLQDGAVGPGLEMATEVAIPAVRSNPAT